MDWRVVCRTDSVEADCCRARRSLEQLESFLGIIQGLLFEFVVFVKVVITSIRILLLLYFQSPFIIKYANIVTSIIRVLGLVMCLTEFHLM
jgi:hypothetical protein